jgi:hypothetical protein
MESAEHAARRASWQARQGDRLLSPSAAACAIIPGHENDGFRPMLILRNLIGLAARRVLSDPKVQAKAADFYDAEVRPRARSAARSARENLDFARSELREAAAEVDPRDNPKEFFVRAKKRLFGDG